MISRSCPCADLSKRSMAKVMTVICESLKAILCRLSAAIIAWIHSIFQKIQAIHSILGSLNASVMIATSLKDPLLDVFFCSTAISPSLRWITYRRTARQRIGISCDSKFTNLATCASMKKTQSQFCTRHLPNWNADIAENSCSLQSRVLRSMRELGLSSVTKKGSAIKRGWC